MQKKQPFSAIQNHGLFWFSHSEISGDSPKIQIDINSLSLRCGRLMKDSSL